MTNCTICPRHCNVNRQKKTGFCGEGHMRVALYDLHKWEEPCVCYGEGSGAIFFSGCNLRCCYCQNYQISSLGKGELVTPLRLVEIIKELEGKGAVNINFVTPTHFTDEIIESLKLYKPKIPVMWNTSGYESVETIEKLAPYVDIFLTDYKYALEEPATKYSLCPDYPSVAITAIKKMIDLKPNVFNDEHLMQGVIIRHLVLPNNLPNTFLVLDMVKANFPNALLSIMSQYTPMPNLQYCELKRKLTHREYDKVLNRVFELELNGFCQELDSATTTYIPKF